MGIPCLLPASIVAVASAAFVSIASHAQAGPNRADELKTVYFEGRVEKFEFTEPNASLPGLDSEAVGCLKFDPRAANELDPPLGQYTAYAAEHQRPALLVRFGVRSRHPDITVRSDVSVLTVNNQEGAEAFAFRGAGGTCTVTDGTGTNGEAEAALEGPDVIRNQAPGDLPVDSTQLNPASAIRNELWVQCGILKFAAQVRISRFSDEPLGLGAEEVRQCAAGSMVAASSRLGAAPDREAGVRPAATRN